MSDNEDKSKSKVPNGVDPKLEDTLQDTSSRARNKTVMLTPEVTGQIRDMLGSGVAKPDNNAPNVSLGKGLPGATDPAMGNGNVPAAAKPATGGSDSWSKPGASGSASPRPSEVAMSGNPVNGAGSRDKTTVLKRDPMTSLMGSPGLSTNNGVDLNGTEASSPTAPAHSMGGAIATGVTSSPAPGVSQTPSPVSAPQVQMAAGSPSMVAEQKSKVVAKSKIIGFFISFDKSENGEVYEIRSGRYMLSSRSAGQEDYIIIQDESISALHAIVRATDDGKIQILDQLSEFGTGVIPVGKVTEDDVSGSMVSVKHGDRVRFGKRKFVVCCVPTPAKLASAANAPNAVGVAPKTAPKLKS